MSFKNVRYGSQKTVSNHLNCEKLLTKSHVHVFFDLHFLGNFHYRNLFYIKLQCNIDNLKSKYLIK